MYIEVVKMTDEEKRAMYMRLSKKELTAMLISANKHIDLIYPKIENFGCKYFNPDTRTTGILCVSCGKSEWEH